VARAVEHGARSMVSLPLAAEGKVLGTLNVYSRQPRRFPAEQVSLAELIASQAGIAMQVAASFLEYTRPR
jgi:GAF domain-containing protein